MMKFVKTDVETALELSEEYIRTLTIENADFFYKTVTEFASLFENAEGGALSFWREHVSAFPAKFGEWVGDIFSLDLNDKKVTSLLHKRLEKELNRENYILSLHKINFAISLLMEDLSFDFPFSSEFDELTMGALLKACNVRLQTNYETLAEKIICYVNIMIELKQSEFFVFTNLKSVLSDEGITQLFRHCQREKVCLLLLESGKGRSSLPFEKSVLITEDLCELLENQEDI